jgi:AcrR family transcriptional regulator
MTPRERILNETLSLFAENGYDGTSVEQIAEKVGIKAPSLYNHFKGKEDILNALIDNAEALYEEHFGSEQRLGKLPESREEFIRITMERVLFTMSNPVIRKIRKFLVQEQFRSDRLAAVTTHHQLVGVQKMYTIIIEGMMEKGLFIKDAPELLANELTAQVVLLIAQADRQPRYEKEITQSIEQHIRHFCDVYMSVQAK